MIQPARVPFFLVVLLGEVTSGAAARFPLQREGDVVTLKRDLAVVSFDSPPREFASVTRLALMPSGAFFLFDGKDVQIRAFDSSGRFLFDVGREGAGPGEYRTVSGMGAHGDSLLLVQDPANGRINVYDMSGASRRPIPFARGGHYAEKALAIDRAGILYLRAPTIELGRRPPSIGSQYIRLQIDGTVLDSMALPTQAADHSSFVLHTADGPRWNFVDRSLFTVLWTGQLLTSDAGDYTLRIHGQGGDRLIRRHADRVPVSPRERREWTAWSEYLGRRLGRTPVRIPEVKPVIRDLRGDAQGRIWVSLYTSGSSRNSPRPPGDSRPPLTIREANVYDVLDDRGQLLGRVTLPPDTALLAIGEQVIWVRAEDRRGREVLVRYRLVGLRDAT